MEQEYVIRENEIGIVFVDGQLQEKLKPGKYKFGTNILDRQEAVRKKVEEKEEFQTITYPQLTNVPLGVALNVRRLERKLRNIRYGFTARQLIEMAKIPFGVPRIERKELGRLYEDELKDAKIRAYGDYNKLPVQVREKIIQLEIEIEDANKVPKIEVKTIDTRQLTLTITGQEMLTRDKVSIRINVIVQYKVKDAVKALTSVVSYEDRLYQQVQMIIRDYACANSLDQLLTNKNTIGKYIQKQVEGLATAIGLQVMEVGLKDIILPGAIQEMMNKVVEAEREGKAKLVRAREEMAAARINANIAKMMQKEGSLQLKQMEVLTEIAKSPATTIYFGVGDELLESMKKKRVTGK